jgi:hypothetical protein
MDHYKSQTCNDLVEWQTPFKTKLLKKNPKWKPHIYDNESYGEEVNEDHFEKPWVVNMCELMRPDDTSPNVEKKKNHNQP